MVDTSVVLSGLRLDNPVIPASGTFGYGAEFRDFYDINILGSFSFKGTTREARFGNPTPRIAECTAGMITAVGKQNPGLDHVVAAGLPRASRSMSTPTAASASSARFRWGSSRSTSRVPMCGTGACRSVRRPRRRPR